MKNKTKTYILLVAVFGLWGTVAYKIFNGLNPEVLEIDTQEFNNTFKPKTIVESDTFSVKNVKIDPFLGTLYSNKKNNTTSKKIKPKVSNNKNLPKITFSGLIKKQNTTDQVFVLNINNRQYLLKKGQIADSVTVVSGNTKEVVVSYNSRSLTIKRQ
ncbi:hypothetical protein [Lacinutrix sp.]|uniref:hypothetical protein n=1 Tax=Lacinutrix sp. TaxID=1937692 RepID=UPI0025C3CBDC|nr:hypothetical protein [Lacinutrix sp.]